MTSSKKPLISALSPGGKVGRKEAQTARFFAFLLFAFFLVPSAVAAQRPREYGGQKGVVNFFEPKLTNPQLRHSREIYVLNGCAYCHGVDLRVRNGEAANLNTAALVGNDVDGDLIIPLLRAGVPVSGKLSPMPNFSSLSQRDLADIVRWIHYARAQRHYESLTVATNSAPGDAAAGKIFFEKSCSSCHAKQGNLANAIRKDSTAALKLQVLRPSALQVPPTLRWRMDYMNNTKLINARRQHQHLLENYSESDVANLLAYLEAK